MDKIAAGSSSDRRDLFERRQPTRNEPRNRRKKNFWGCFVLICVIYAAILGMVTRCLGGLLVNQFHQLAIARDHVVFHLVGRDLGEELLGTFDL
jgi:hypothetical protein